MKKSDANGGALELHTIKQLYGSDTFEQAQIDANSLFPSCAGAIKAAKHGSKHSDDLSDISGYALRLEICQHMLVNDSLLRQIFSNIIDAIYAPYQDHVVEQKMLSFKQSMDIEFSSYTSLYSRLGLEYRKVLGDGHCLFNAVGIHLGESQESLRQTVAEEIENHIELYREVIEGLNPDRTTEDYLYALRHEVEWAGDLEISVLMQALNRPIVVMNPNGTIRNLATIVGEGDPIFVQYNGVNHYDALLLTGGMTAGAMLETLTQQSNSSLAHAPEEDKAKLPETGLKLEVAIVESNNPYNIIKNGLPINCRQDRLVDNICKIVSQHYSEVSDADIRARSDAQSISSYSSLEDEEDYAHLWESNFDISFAEHEASVKSFLYGSKVITEAPSNGGNTEDNPTYRIARRYVDHVEANDNHIGGPIEIQAISDIYDWKIALHAFTGRDANGKPQYTEIFEPSKPKNTPLFVSIVLTRAGTPAAKFRLESSDIETGSFENVYMVLSTMLASKSDENINLKGKVIEYLRGKIARSHNFRLAEARGDGITNYFYNYIHSGYKGRGDEIKEFDLIPTLGCQCIADAHKLRAQRKAIFKNANTILEMLSDEIKTEFAVWSMPRISLDVRKSTHAISNRRTGVITTLTDVSQIIAFGLTITSAVLAENSTSAGFETYRFLQWSSFATNAIGSIVYSVTLWNQENNRAKAARAAQDELVANLPLDRISEIKIVHEGGKVKSYIAPFKNVPWLTEWSTENCIMISFLLTGQSEELSITKQRNVSGDYVVANTETQSDLLIRGAKLARDFPWIRQGSIILPLALLATINLGLTIGSAVDVDKQQNMAVNTSSASNATETEQLTVSSPATANASIAMAALSALIMLVASTCRVKRSAENELSEALKNICNTYSGNNGQLPKGLSNLVQQFGADAMNSEALISLPQMENIQRSLFKAKQELHEHIQVLRAEKSKPISSLIPDEQQLLDQLEKIEKLLDVSNIAGLHEQGDASLKVLTLAIKEVIPDSQQQASARRLSISSTVRRLSGILGFSASASSKKEPPEKSSKRDAGLRPSKG